MKSVIRNASRNLLIAGGLTLAATAANAQMKIGDNPSVITKSAILELSSTKQGLLLPRVADFTAIDAAIGTDAVDGMIVYLNSSTAANNGVYMRKAGAWVKIASAADAAANWGLTGNAGTTAANYVGTSDAQPLSIRSNGTEGISVQTTGAVQLKQVSAITTDGALDVLVIESDGTIVKKSLPGYAWKSLLTNVDNTITSLNTTAAADGQVTINAPIMDGTATKSYGFMTLSDWNKLNNLATGNSFTVTALITAAAATADATKGAQIQYNTTTNQYELSLIEATASRNGIVTTNDQTFAGNKTFNNNVGVGGALGVTGATTLGSTLGVTGATTLNSTLGVTGAATLNNTLDVSGKTTLGNDLGVTAGNVTVSTGNLTLTSGNASVGGTSTLNGTVTLNAVATTTETGAVNVLIQNTTSKAVELRSFNMDAIENAITLIKTGATSTAGGTVQFLPGTTGADVNIVADGTAKTVTFNVPDASAIDASHTAVQRGLVSTSAQSFAGSKSYADSIAIGQTTTPNSTLQVNGSVAMAIKTVTAAYTVTAADNTVLADATSGAFTVTLPAPAASIAGRIYTIKKIGTGDIDKAVTIMPGGGTIEGGTSYVIYNDWTFITIQTDGTNWYIIKK